MTTFFWVIGGTLAISLISFIGALTLFFREELLKKIILPLVSLSAGALLGGAFLHMIPEALDKMVDSSIVFTWVLVGIILFFLMEQFIHWHHCHRMPSEHKTPVTYLILFADGLHNFIDGLAIAGALVVSLPVGIITCLVTAAHEIPQELGDFGILIHGGWRPGKALLFNFISGLTAVAGGLLVYFLSRNIDVTFLLPFAAGNFIYIASSDLIPEIKHNDNFKTNLLHFTFFILGIIFIFLVGSLEH